MSCPIFSSSVIFFMVSAIHFWVALSSGGRSAEAARATPTAKTRPMRTGMRMALALVFIMAEEW